MHILMIDDDEDSSNLLRIFLENEGFMVHGTLSGSDGVQLVRKFHPDLVLLDVLLPGMDGRDVCQCIRSFSDVPILMISAFATQVGDMVQGLHLGADDYLAKPINFDLLKAHVIALLRRKSKIAQQQYHPRYTDAYLSVDLDHQQVRVRERPVSLSSLQYQLLEILVTNIDQALPSCEIIEELWPGADYLANISRNRLYSLVKSLRQAIEPEPDAPLYIVSEHGFGYRFCSQL